MSDVGMDKLARLFTNQAGMLVNVKFCRGAADVIEPESLIGAFVDSVVRSRSSGKKVAHRWPSCRYTTEEAADWLNSLQ